MLPAFASAAQLSARLPGGLDQGDYARAQAALQDASTLIRSAANKTWVDDENELAVDLPDIVVTIAIKVARRAIENPDGIAQQQETTGPFSKSTSYPGSSADVYLTAEEKRLIAEATGAGGLAVISVTRGPLETRSSGDTTYLPVDPPGQAIPFLDE